MPSHLCPGCFRPHSGHGRCPDCAPAAERRRHNRAYDTGAYRSARNAAVAAWVRAHGWRCPGDGEHPAHETRDLTADHPVALANGGPLIQEFAIMCRSANSRKGAR